MLVLHRKVEEKVVISHPAIGEIVVTVLGIPQHGKVKLGFVAPPDVKIFRTEVLERTPHEIGGEG